MRGVAGDRNPLARLYRKDRVCMARHQSYTQPGSVICPRCLCFDLLLGVAAAWRITLHTAPVRFRHRLAARITERRASPTLQRPGTL